MPYNAKNPKDFDCDEGIGFFLGIFKKIYLFTKNIPICKNRYILYTYKNIPIFFENIRRNIPIIKIAKIRFCNRK